MKFPETKSMNNAFRRGYLLFFGYSSYNEKYRETKPRVRKNALGSM